jgi:DNA-directed RNA polymerase specialized sigma24 family protein
MLRTVTDLEMEEMSAQWGPKIRGFCKNRLPFLEDEDKSQEALIILWKCLRRFDTGNGASFHTYFHSALRNRGGRLVSIPLRHNAELVNFPLLYDSQRMKRDGELKKVLLKESPQGATYMSEVDVAMEDGSGAHMTDLTAAITTPFDPDLEFIIESYGFTGTEIPYMAGIVQGISLKETADLFHVDVGDLKKARQTAKAKMLKLRGEITNGTNS